MDILDFCWPVVQIYYFEIYHHHLVFVEEEIAVVVVVDTYMDCKEAVDTLGVVAVACSSCLDHTLRH
jgi:hypothetical protein